MNISLPCRDVRKEFTLRESFWFGNLKKESKNGGCRRQCQQQQQRETAWNFLPESYRSIYIMYTHSRQEQDERVGGGGGERG